ncbi:hypothetical protein [Rhodopirellula baltica]|uniref:hypothetical protein n=1 Tax=Rhodopirellula baltica TaxID=265606 RepID=UPI0011819CB0|nr:hypothetical protein [Rhodopirellula baltica]
MIALAVAGCASPHIRTDRRIRSAFDSIDELQVGEHRITDPEIIDRLAAIHAKSKWDPVPITLPVGLIAIHGIDDGERRFKLIYSGWLWETDDSGQITRRGTLTEADRDWMEQQFRTLVPLPTNVL